MPIGEQHTQRVAEARSALTRDAMMAATRRCTIVHATRGCPAGRRRCGNAKQLGLNCFLVCAQVHAARIKAKAVSRSEMSNMQ